MAKRARTKAKAIFGPNPLLVVRRVEVVPPDIFALERFAQPDAYASAAILGDEDGAGGLERDADFVGAPVSNALIVDTGRPAVSASFACDQPIRARAALTCAASTMALRSFRRCRGYRNRGGGG